MSMSINIWQAEGANTYKRLDYRPTQCRLICRNCSVHRLSCTVNQPLVAGHWSGLRPATAVILCCDINSHVPCVPKSSQTSMRKRRFPSSVRCAEYSLITTCSSSSVMPGTDRLWRPTAARTVSLSCASDALQYASRSESRHRCSSCLPSSISELMEPVSCVLKERCK